MKDEGRETRDEGRGTKDEGRRANPPYKFAIRIPQSAIDYKDSFVERGGDLNVNDTAE